MLSKRSKVFLVFILLVASFGAGLFLGKVWQIQDLVTDDKGAVEIVNLVNKD